MAFLNCSQACMDGPVLKVTGSAFNNEFFTSAAQSWKERLSEGLTHSVLEITLYPNQQSVKQTRVKPPCTDTEDH